MATKQLSNSNGANKEFCIPKPQSIMKFIIYPSMWKLPDFRHPASVFRRLKTNLLFFQTNYLILNLALFALSMILSMKTLLTGILSAAIITVAVLFFMEHIPQARQIKQDHPNLVIIVGLILVVLTWRALYTIFIVVGAILAPVPLWLLHAAFRSSEHLIDGTKVSGLCLSQTPMGQIMQMLGIEPRVYATEYRN